MIARSSCRHHCCYWLIIGLTVNGCSTIRLSNPTASETNNDGWTYKPYDKLLHSYVVEGLVDYGSLKANATDMNRLNRFLSLIGEFGPQSTAELFTDRQAQLAYWINVHNAVALAAAVEKHPAKTVKPFLGQFDRHVSCRVDRRWLTLSDISANATAAAAGDPRVALALMTPAVGSGHMPDAPFLPQTIDQQLTQLLSRAIDDPRLVKIDHENLTLWLGRPIYDVRQRYVQQYRRAYDTDSGTIVNALAVYADAHQRRKLNRAIGYTVRMTSYDWSLNEWSRPPCSLD